jgi:hypothetical protein
MKKSRHQMRRINDIVRDTGLFLALENVAASSVEIAKGTF